MTKVNQAILLSAGLGTRLAPITDLLPKCLVPVNGYPLSHYWLEALTRAGCTKIFVNLHYQTKFVKGVLSNSPFRSRIEFFYEDELLGTAGTISKLSNLLEDGPAWVIHADNLSRFSERAFLDAYDNSHSLMMTFATDSPKSCGIVELDGLGRICAFYEKVENPPGNNANGAVYIFHPSLLEWIHSNDDLHDISMDVIPHHLSSFRVWKNSEYHRDIGTINSFLSAQRTFVRPTNAYYVYAAWQDFWADSDFANAKVLCRHIQSQLPQEKWEFIGQWSEPLFKKCALNGVDGILIGVAPNHLCSASLSQAYGVTVVICSREGAE